MMPLTPYLCTNCGFWQRHFAVPPSCPVCTDFRHTPPAEGWRFRSAEEIAGEVQTRWAGEDTDIVTFWTVPRVGIGSNGYLLRRPEGNVFFDGTAHYGPEALSLIASLGGVRWLSASHPHAYGALWQLQERFAPEVAIQVQDLPWTGAFGTSWPFDDRLDLAPGVTLIHTGGHFGGHAVLSLADRRVLFAGDMLKFHRDQGQGCVTGISTHKGFNRRIPMSHAEIRRYRAVVADLDFDTVYTTFEAAACTPGDVLRLFDAQLGGKPFFGPMPINTQ
jgi:glyoxylase-like metal-dependent hydrolase (beta-lactamase superfamily II)